MPSIFTKIIEGEIPCYKIAETNDYLAFLDIHPLTKGHTLVVPKVEVDEIFDLTPEQFSGLHLFSQLVAAALKRATGKRIGVAVIGIEVPHAHIHLIPFESMNEMNFSNPKLSLSAEEMTQIAKAIRAQFN